MTGAGDLRSVDVRNGVNEAGDPFLTVVATAADGRMMVGQLSPDEVRAMALAWLGAAEAAQQDAAVLRVVRRLDLPDGFAGAVIVELRNLRGDDEADP